MKLLCTEICSEKRESITSDAIVIELEKVLSYTCVRYWNGTSTCDDHLKKKPKNSSPIQTEYLTWNYKNQTKNDVRAIFYY